MERLICHDGKTGPSYCIADDDLTYGDAVEVFHGGEWRCGHFEAWREGTTNLPVIYTVHGIVHVNAGTSVRLAGGSRARRKYVPPAIKSEPESVGRRKRR